MSCQPTDPPFPALTGDHYIDCWSDALRETSELPKNTRRWLQPSSPPTKLDSRFSLLPTSKRERAWERNCALRLRRYIKHSRQCFIGYPNTSNFVKNTLLRVVFSTLFSVFGYSDETPSLMFDILHQRQRLPETSNTSIPAVFNCYSFLLNTDVFWKEINLLFELSFFKNSGRPDSGLSGRCKVEPLEAEEEVVDWLLFLSSQAVT